MSRGNSLPFPYGDTMWQGDSTLISASQYTHLEGATYEQIDLRNGTNQRMTLRVVRNKSGGVLYKGRGVKFGVTAQWLGRKVRGYVSTLGEFGMPIDDQLTTSVKSNDLFYVVEKGPAYVLAASLTTGATALAQAQKLTFTTGGLLSKAAAGRYDLGICMEGTAVTAAVTGNRRCLVQIGGLFSDIE